MNQGCTVFNQVDLNQVVFLKKNLVGYVYKKKLFYRLLKNVMVNLYRNHFS